MTFIGEHIAKLDDKGRLIFPSEFRVQVGTLNTQYVIHRNIHEDDRLEMYPLDEWEKYAEKVKAKLNLLTHEGSSLWAEFNRGRAMVAPDEKMGRMTIPKHLLEAIKVQKEVVFYGLDNMIQIWSKEAWEEWKSNDNRSDFAKRFDDLMR
jgi:MraZ protein